MSAARYAPSRSFCLLFTLLLAPLAFVPGARAATLDVCASGCPYASVHAAVNAAVSGDVIRIRQGYYEGDVEITDKSLTLKGVGASQTTIRGTGTNSVVYLSCASPATAIAISNVTLSGGSGRLLDQSGESTESGGGLFNFGCTASLKNSVVSNNTVNFMGGGIANFGTLTITGSTVVDNTVTHFFTGGLSGGGGIANLGTLTLKDGTVAHNTSGSFGGGIANQRGGTLAMTDSRVIDNTAGGGPGSTPSRR